MHGMVEKILRKFGFSQTGKMLFQPTSINSSSVRLVPLSLPDGYSKQDLFNYLLSAKLAGAPGPEMLNYLNEAFLRFLYTLSLVPHKTGKLLEIGANPYFTTLLLKTFRNYELALTNYFGPDRTDGADEVAISDPHSGIESTFTFNFKHFNCEAEPFPFENSFFDVVLFCEVIEHLLTDPMKCLLEIRRILKPGGVLVLTTPNVARLENVSRLILGQNLYDPYSGYGPYGRHNREYTRHEIVTLLDCLGFSVPDHFTSDIHESVHFVDEDKLVPLVEFRSSDLGSYLFVRAIRDDNKSIAKERPSWLFRSFYDREPT